jgi:hypothetical protein
MNEEGKGVEREGRKQQKSSARSAIAVEGMMEDMMEGVMEGLRKRAGKGPIRASGTYLGHLVYVNLQSSWCA